MTFDQKWPGRVWFKVESQARHFSMALGAPVHRLITRASSMEYVHNVPTMTGWWYTNPSEKYELVNWDYCSQYMEKSNAHLNTPYIDYLGCVIMLPSSVICVFLKNMIPMNPHNLWSQILNHPSSYIIILEAMLKKSETLIYIYNIMYVYIIYIYILCIYIYCVYIYYVYIYIMYIYIMYIYNVYI